MKALRLLDCGCNDCRKTLANRFVQLVEQTWTEPEILDLIDQSVIGFGQQTLAQNIAAYTMKEV